MELIDRIQGERRLVADAESVSEARYRLPACLEHNGHTPLGADDVLLDDGSARVRFVDGERHFLRAELASAEREDLALALDAVVAIIGRTDLAAGTLPSPLLPPELGRQIDPSELETVLDEVFARGHLETITEHPRLSMRYDSELLPVDRARRLDNGFQRHLAAHSECWAARTLSGIVPKAVVARISEDEPHIYENRVFARLVDHLERYLRGRIARLEEIGESCRKALAFENSQDVDYRLRQDICDVWGEASDAQDLLARNDERLQRLRNWLKRIRGLQDGELYAAIPRKAEIGLSLSATNLLLHDTHYRQLRRLWQAWLAATASERERPAQVLERRRIEQRSYEQYVGLVLLRALQQLGFEVTMRDAAHGRAEQPRWPERLTLRCERHEWHIEVVEVGAERLVLVPAAVALDAEIARHWHTCRRVHQGMGELRVPCVPRVPNASETDEPCARLENGAPALLLSPMDLYTEERLVTLLSGWLWRQRPAGYGEIFRLPEAVVRAWPEPSLPDGRGLALRRPVNEEQKKALEGALAQHVNDSELRRRVERRLAQLDNLGRCPECDKAATLFEPGPNGFFARCQCGREWKVREGVFTVSERGVQVPAFRTLGRRWLQVSLAEEP